MGREWEHDTKRCGEALHGRGEAYNIQEIRKRLPGSEVHMTEKISPREKYKGFGERFNKRMEEIIRKAIIDMKTKDCPFHANCPWCKMDKEEVK